MQRHKRATFQHSLAGAAVLLGAWAETAWAAPLSEISNAGLVGLWTFEDGEGTAIADQSGNGNTATEIYPEDKTPRWGEGAFAGSLLLTATTNNYVQVPASPSLNSITGAITVVATVYARELWTPQWEKPGTTVLVQRQWQISKHPDQYYLGYEVKGGTLTYKWHVGLADGGEVWIDGPVDGAAIPKVAAWVQVAGTYDAATGIARLYVDGVPSGMGTGVGTIRLDPKSLRRPLAIGAELNRENDKDVEGEFDGYIDEVRLYSRALSPEELAALAAESARLQK